MNVAPHFAGKDPAVRATYQRLIDVARTLGPVTEEAKKTSIHLERACGSSIVMRNAHWEGSQCRA
jgi:hypothetical protein